MKAIKAHTIYLEGELELAIYQLDEIKKLSPYTTFKLWHLKANKSPWLTDSKGGWAIATKMFFTCQAKGWTGYGMEKQN